MKLHHSLILAVATGLAAAAISYLLSRPATPSASDPNSLREIAQRSFPGRRAYALPLNNPDMIPVAQASYMRDEDAVIGVQIDRVPRAYPWWLISNYHVVNDTVDEQPLLLTLCEVCGGTSAFRPAFPDLPNISLSFQLSGVSYGTIEISDHQTWSTWQPFLGRATAGPLQGRWLPKFASALMTWKEWKTLFPESLVAHGSPHLRNRFHGAESGCIGDPDIPALFQRTANLSDDRLGRHELVFGLVEPPNTNAWAVPLRLLEPFPSLFVVRAGSRHVLLVRQSTLAVTAFNLDPSHAHGEWTLLASSPILFRRPDGSAWNIFGVCQTAEPSVEPLSAANGHLTEWYEWVSHSPHSEILSTAKSLAPHPRTPDNTKPPSGR